MDADWSVECGGDDPFVVIPWQNASGTLTYIDLRAELLSDSEAVQKIPEARQFPALAAALQRWNDATSPLLTAKCDVWSYPAKLFDAEDLPGFAFARGSYVDLLPVTAEIFQNFAAAEGQLRRWTEMSRGIATPDARCEWILRRAMLAASGTALAEQNLADQNYVHGYAATLYVWGYGASQQAAAEVWGSALERLIDPTLAVAAATIER